MGRDSCRQGGRVPASGQAGWVLTPMTATSPPSDPDAVRSPSSPEDLKARFEAEVVPQARCRPREFHGGCHRSGTAIEATALTLRVESTMNSPEEPRFSIVVPAYNEAACLGPALQALQLQDFREPYEIIVVDNDSTDRTGEIAASYGVTVVRETARGVCQARQRGTIEARGEIVVSTDADTVQPRDWLTRIDRQFRRSDQIVAVAGPCHYENPSWWARLYPKLLLSLIHI